MNMFPNKIDELEKKQLFPLFLLCFIYKMFGEYMSSKCGRSFLSGVTFMYFRKLRYTPSKTPAIDAFKLFGEHACRIAISQVSKR